MSRWNNPYVAEKRVAPLVWTEFFSRQVDLRERLVMIVSSPPVFFQSHEGTANDH